MLFGYFLTTSTFHNTGQARLRDIDTQLDKIMNYVKISTHFTLLTFLECHAVLAKNSIYGCKVVVMSLDLLKITSIADLDRHVAARIAF